MAQSPSWQLPHDREAADRQGRKNVRMDPDQYVDERVKQYQGWYDRKAVMMKRRYLQMRTVAVLAGAVVPVLVNVSGDAARVVTTVLSLIVVIIVSLESVFHYREQWKNYRSTEQYLGHEIVLFDTRTGPYADLEGRDAFTRFVDRVESAIAAENASTLNTMTLAGQAATESNPAG